MGFVFVNEISCTSVNFAFKINTVSLRIKNYSEIKDIRFKQYKNFWLCYLGKGVMVSHWGYSCLATMVFCGITVNWHPVRLAI